ncbi:hypothetical protein ACFL6G_09750 [candidate division KSB1 bacterium]
MFFRRYKPRKFEYTPVRYDPEADEREKNRKRIEFRRMANTYKKGYSFPKLLIMVAILVFLLYYLSKLS